MEAFALKQIAEKKRKAEIAKLEEERARTAGPVKITKEEQVYLNRLFGVPDAPVGASCVGKGGTASVWWTLESNSHVSLEPYIIVKIGKTEMSPDVVLDGADAVRAAAAAAAAAMTDSLDVREWMLRTIAIGKRDDGSMPPIEWAMETEFDLGNNTTETSGHGLKNEGRAERFAEQSIKVTVMDQISGIKVAFGELALKDTDLWYEPPPPPPTPPDSDDEKPDEWIPAYDDFGQQITDDKGEPVMKLKPRPDKKKKARKKIRLMKEAKKRNKKRRKERAKLLALQEAGGYLSETSLKSFGSFHSRRPGTADSVATDNTSDSGDEPARPGTAATDQSRDSSDAEGGADVVFDKEDLLNWPIRPKHAIPWEEWMEGADAFDVDGNPQIYTKKGNLIPMLPPGPDPYSGLELQVQLYDAREDKAKEKAGVFTMKLRREKIIPPDEMGIPEDETPEERKARRKLEKKRKKEEKKRLKKEKKAKKKEEKKLKADGIDPEDMPVDEPGLDPDDPDKEPEEDPNKPTDILHIEGDFKVIDLRKVMLAETIIGWEVHRYRRTTKEWAYKGFKEFGPLQSYHVRLEQLTDESQYRFTVKARNRIGLSPESDPSNPIIIEQPLPAGWFRFYNEDQGRFYYANMKTRQSRWERPDMDPYFLEEWIMLNFDRKEIRHLRELYDEEMTHFDKVTVTRFIALLKECGEILKRRPVTGLFRGLIGDDEKVTTWADFMTIVNHIKKRKTQPVIPTAPLGLVYFLSRRAVSAMMGDESKKFGPWTTKYNEMAEKEFYVNSETGEMRWDMPEEVRFYLPPKLEDKLLHSFTPGQCEKFKMQFSQVDVDGSGDISDTELRMLLESMGIHVDDKTFKRLINIVDLNGNGTIEYDEFCWMLLSLHDKEKGGLWESLDLGGDGDDDHSLSDASQDTMKSRDSLKNALQKLDFDKIGEGAFKIMQEMEVNDDSFAEESTFGMDGVLPPISVSTVEDSNATEPQTEMAGIFSRASTTLTELNRRASMALQRISTKASVASPVAAIQRARKQSVAFVREAAKSVTSNVRDKLGQSAAGKHGPYCFCGCRNPEAAQNKIYDD